MSIMQSPRLIPISKLTHLVDNPRTITKDQMDKLCIRMQKDQDFIWCRPCLVNEVDDKLIVYAGNQRVRAAKKLKWKDIPCIVEKNLSEEVIKERTISDNTHFGEWDMDSLANNYDLTSLLECGLDFKDLYDIPNDKEIEDIESTEEKEEIPQCKLCPQCGFDLTNK